ncbi:hypothetical protein CH063_03125 [Colletotrichum higginsianum]|uniref:Uncharacterized protein n=1 Tax=Colletotrichum higginsianum (strain IMI 349063) TaxID=759273 RepID=H1VTP6_COLHI|nr:hypothetical protein CH63R_08346 [Colletotrichum higginsianum IMI 349063]OBR09581.1 hypothetical protein CH63R_08346 [Colletotrichum higginsianum IMI 349063]CCF43604.1 hypothetical protein CH063_03125 [Colletotrichum higginsianum]
MARCSGYDVKRSSAMTMEKQVAKALSRYGTGNFIGGTMSGTCTLLNIRHCDLDTYDVPLAAMVCVGLVIEPR